MARLLTDEMRARVRAATFVRAAGFVVQEGQMQRCPLAVAADRPDSVIDEIMVAFGVDSVRHPNWDTIWDFARWADRGFSDPADVYALLDCLPDDAARPPDGTTERVS